MRISKPRHCWTLESMRKQRPHLQYWEIIRTVPKMCSCFRLIGRHRHRWMLKSMKKPRLHLKLWVTIWIVRHRQKQQEKCVRLYRFLLAPIIPWGCAAMVR